MPDELHNLREAYQRTIFLHGLAGGGMSFVIRAWVALAESWYNPNAVRTCALTGIAAVNVEGFHHCKPVQRKRRLQRQAA